MKTTGKCISQAPRVSGQRPDIFLVAPVKILLLLQHQQISPKRGLNFSSTLNGYYMFKTIERTGRKITYSGATEKFCKIT